MSDKMREAVLQILHSYKQEMESYEYYRSNPGVSVDDFDDIANEIVAWQAAQDERKDKPAECVNGCPDKQVCDYCQGVAAIMPCGASVTNVYEAYDAGKKAAQAVPVVGEAVENAAKSIASMVDEWVHGCIKNNGNWQESLPALIHLRLKRCWPSTSITAAELERLRKDAESYRRLVAAAKAEADTHCTYPDCICPDGVSTGSCNLGLLDAAIAAEGEKK